MKWRNYGFGSSARQYRPNWDNYTRTRISQYVKLKSGWLEVVAVKDSLIQCGEYMKSLAVSNRGGMKNSQHILLRLTV